MSHLHSIFELLGNSWQFMANRAVHTRAHTCAGGQCQGVPWSVASEAIPYLRQRLLRRDDHPSHNDICNVNNV